MSEHDEQAVVFEWGQLQAGLFPELQLLFAIPNGAKLPWKEDEHGQRYSREALKMKAEGLKAGVPDMCLPVARGGWHGLFIELKVGRNKPSEAQLIWIYRLQLQGYRCCVAYGADQAIQILRDYLGIE
jgi:hypothetical protein